MALDEFSPDWKIWAGTLLMRNRSIERFSYDLEMKRDEQKRNNKRTEIERFDWFIERIKTRVAFVWLSERSGEKTSCPRTFQKSTDTSLWRHTATRLTTQTMPSLYKGFLWRENEEVIFWSIHPLADKTTNEHIPKPFFKVIRKLFTRNFEPLGV